MSLMKENKMKIFIWHYISECSTNYHKEGGVVVIAKDEAMARELANSEPGCNIRNDEYPDLILECVDTQDKVFIMPDAGCC